MPKKNVYRPTHIKARDDLPSVAGQTISFGNQVDEVRLQIEGDTLFVVADRQGSLAMTVTLPINTETRLWMRWAKATLNTTEQTL